MNKTKIIIDKILLALSSLLLLTMVVLSLWQILSRYVFNISSPGMEELTRYLLIWFGLMSAAYVFGAKKAYRHRIFPGKIQPDNPADFTKIIRCPRHISRRSINGLWRI